ncbi:MAG: alpha/beta hydrolase [Bryobacterales bacterium]|nr:alpha/beta hydrolase [Bryobacterales bacterium]
MWMLLASLLFSFNLGDFKMQNGQVLENCRVTYRTYGELNRDRSNVILVPTWYNGRSEDMERYIGAGRLLDDTKYYIVVVDALGNGSSSSPSNHRTQRGNSFPGISIRDMVETQHRLLTQHLGIRHVHAVLGISMGGMQAYEWMTAYPDFMSKSVPIVGTPQMSEKDIRLWTSHFKIFSRAGGGVDVSNGEEGDSQEDAGAPKKTMMEQILGMAQAGASQYKRFMDPFNPLKQFDAIRTHSITPKGTALLEAKNRIKADFFAVIASTDTAVYPDTPIEFSKQLNQPFLLLDSKCGHSAFKCDHYTIAAAVKDFLEK